MKVVTTVHKAGFDLYGHRWLESAKNWPGDSVLYAEGFGAVTAGRPNDVERVHFHKVENLARLTDFKARHAAYIPPMWRFDIVRFSHKVFAAYDALYDHDGIGVWLDADCVTYKPIPEGYIEEQLGDAYMARFDRTGHYTETGLWIVDCRHPEHKAFFDTWLQWFESGAYKQLSEWHDCTTLDATIRLFERDGRIKVKSLSGEHAGSMNPIAASDFSRFVQHLKGPRKGLQFDPDNENARAFYEAQA